MGNNPRRNSSIIDVINLYPSIPIDKAIIVLIDTFNNDLDDLNTCTKLTLTNIHKLRELCLGKSYFLYENKSRLLENAGPIGLSLMVILPESYLQYLERKARALTIHIQPKTFKRYVDDSHARFSSKHQANTFQEKQNPAIQYTIEYENGNKSLNFLDINITNITFKKSLPTYISNQHHVLTLTPSKVHSKISFTEHTRCVPRKILTHFSPVSHFYIP